MTALIDTPDTTTDRSDLNTGDLSPAPAHRQPGVLVEFYLEGRPEPLEVRIVNRDRIAYEKALARHKEWPTAEHGTHFAMTFHLWNAATRAGLVTLTFDQFADQMLDYDAVAEEPADPTR